MTLEDIAAERGENRCGSHLYYNTQTFILIGHAVAEII